MLNLYVANTQLLLQNPAAPTTLYSSANIITFVNTARLHIAGETGCVRDTVTLSVTSAGNIYPFSSITGIPAGGAGVYAVRQATINSGSGQVYMGSRPYPWAVTYWLNNAAPVAAQPTEWTQYGIGVNGSLLINPKPDTNYVLNLDALIEPISLATDADIELIPYAMTDAVPYMASYYAYMSAQRQQDADTMLQRYEDFKGRAKKIAVPNVLPLQYDQHEEAPQRPQAAAGPGGG